jgi:hypothetical protein
MKFYDKIFDNIDIALSFNVHFFDIVNIESKSMLIVCTHFNHFKALPVSKN